MLMVSAASLAFLAHPGVTRLARLWAVMRVYLLAQPLKYLPGKVWAITYQIFRVGEETGGRMAVAASASQMVVSAFGSVVVFGIASGGHPILLPAATLTLALWLWRGGASRYLGIADEEWMSLSQNFRVLGSIAFEWAAFALACWLISKSLGSGGQFSFVLMALYSIAWIIGSLASITPGGLVIREGGFIMLCQINGVPSEFAGAFAILARLVFTFSELLAAGISLSIAPTKFGSR